MSRSEKLFVVAVGVPALLIVGAVNLARICVEALFGPSRSNYEEMVRGRRAGRPGDGW